MRFAILVLCLSSLGCSMGSPTASSGSSASTTQANISGTVSNSSAGLSSKPTKSSHVTSVIAGCAVEAHDLTSNAKVSSAQSDANGNFTVTGVATGVTYKMLVNCGGTQLASVATAVTSDTTNIGADARVATNPRTTVIAAYVVQAIFNALTTATSSSSDPIVQAKIRSAILASLDSVIQAVSSSINAAIESGSMTEPSLAQASGVGAALGVHADPTSAVAAAPPAPASVTQAQTGAQSSAVTLQTCSAAFGGSEPACTQSIAKFLYNSLNFPVQILKTGGAFGAVGNCDNSNAPLQQMFPNSAISTSNEYCLIQPTVATPNRNAGYTHYESDDSTTVFAESGTGSIPVGALTGLAHSMFVNRSYNLYSVDRFMFAGGFGAGFNARLFNYVLTPAAGFETQSFYYYHDAAWTQAAWDNTCSISGRTDDVPGTLPCNPNNIQWGFTTDSWASGTSHAVLSTAIGAGDNAHLGVSLLKFGGALPNQTSLDAYLDQGRTHVDLNPSGEKELQLLTLNSAYSNACYDSDPTTPCLDATGAPVSPVRVDLAFNGTANSQGIKTISSITANNSSGAYYVRPYIGYTGFMGLLGFVKVADGTIVRDELLRERAIKVILSHASECGSNGITSADCTTEGLAYNVALLWNNCENSSAGCPGYVGYGSTSAKIAQGSAFPITPYYRTISNGYCDNTGCVYHQLVSSGSASGYLPYKFNATAHGTAPDTLTLLPSAGTASASGELNLATTTNGFYLVDDLGVPRGGGSVTMTIPGRTTWPAAQIFTLAQIDSATNGNYDFVSGSHTTLEAIAAGYTINQGPILNPNFACESEPFYIDMNHDGQLNCGMVNGVSRAISGDVSFSSEDEYTNWLNNPTLSNADRTTRAAYTLMPVENAFRYGDPVGAKKLISLALNGWLDGKHQLTSTTSLTALQALAFLYLIAEADGPYQTIDGLIPGQNKFELISPSPGSAGLTLFNQQLGGAFSAFYN